MAVVRTTGTVTSGDEEIYYESFGDGSEQPVVVLTHGAGGTHAAWFNQLLPLTAAGYRVVTWDSRGFGNSTNRTDNLAADVAAGDLAAILDALGVTTPVHLVGQSMGGWFVSAFAISRPERTASLTLSDTIGGLYTDELRAHFREFMAGPGLTTGNELGQHRAIGETTLAESPIVGVLYEQLGSFHTPPMALVGPLLAETSFSHDAVDALDIDVLFIVGNEDRIFPIDLLRATAGRLQRATFVEISGSGHSPYFERPEQFNQALLDFLD